MQIKLENAHAALGRETKEKKEEEEKKREEFSHGPEDKHEGIV